MPQRSQLRKQANQNYQPPAVAGISPDTASIARAGAVNRTIATMSVTGGTPPVTYTVAAAAGLALNILGNLLRTNADPVGPLGAAAVSITATDAWGQAKTETITVTVT